MKTVMKKMFCLMLVAVLMVGVMPFQASAADLPVTAHLNIGDTVSTVTADRAEGSWTASVNDIIVQWFSEDPSRFSNATLEEADGTMHYDADLTTSVVAGQTIHIRLHETAVPEKCETCGNDKHEGVCCSKCKVVGHSDVNHCTYCNSLEHLSSAHCSVCEEIGCDSSKHCTLCGSKEHTASLHCATCGVLGHLAAEHCTVCNEYGCVAANHCGICASKDHATANCPYCAVCYAKGDTNVTSHTTAAHCTTCDTVNGHKTSCANYSAPVTGTAKLHVWATLHVGKKAIESRLIDTIEGLSPDAKIYQVVSDNRARIVSKFPSGYGIESWTNNLYYMIDADTAHTVNSRLTVGEEDDVVINLYTEQKLVIARVHLGKDYSVDMAVQLNGFRVGDVVTEKDVKNAIKKYYSVSGMKIYTPAEWENVVAGKDANNITNFIVQGGDNDNVYEVYISGARNTYANSTTYKADSSNPKTGDMIFAPVAVLGLSASALAVLFFLNKKRAF